MLMDELATDSALGAGSTARQVRLAARSGSLRGHTSGLAREHVQGNLVILPAAQAGDFLRFCQANPKPCPLLAVTEPGQFMLDSLGEDIDIRTDVPRYRVWKDGALHDEPTELTSIWRDDFVSFVLGCSFSFEHALLAAGIPLRHVDAGTNVAMYRTNIPTKAAGMYHGPVVVSMRPMKAADAIKAVQITSRIPEVHGAPIHLGDPRLIGILDISKPDFGDPVEVRDDELPVFWACGVTPQAAVQASRPALCISHAPGAMLVTDLLNRKLGLG